MYQNYLNLLRALTSPIHLKKISIFLFTPSSQKWFLQFRLPYSNVVRIPQPRMRATCATRLNLLDIISLIMNSSTSLTNYVASLYTVLSVLLSLPLSYAEMFSPAPFSQTHLTLGDRQDVKHG
jgi:hypothetical protein